MTSNLRTKIIVMALSVTLLTIGTPIQTALAEEQGDLTTLETQDIIVEGEGSGEEVAATSENALAPLAAGDVFIEGDWEYTVIAEPGATGTGTARVTGYQGSTAASFILAEVTNQNTGITYTVSEFDLGSSGVSAGDTRASIQSLTFHTVQLSTIDVSGCTDLTSLFASFTGISSLDVSNNRMLTSLSCAHNNISSLDVSMLTNLEYLDVDHNNLTALDVTNNSQLRGLSNNDNSIGSLDLSNNTLLEYLNTENNRLTTLDVSNNPLLYEIIAFNNMLLEVKGLNNMSSQNLTDYNFSDQTVTFIMTDPGTGMYVSKQTGLLSIGSVFTGPAGLSYNSSTQRFNAPIGAEFPSSVNFTTMQGSFDVSGTIQIVFETVYSYPPEPAKTPASDGLAKTSDGASSGLAALLGMAVLGLAGVGVGRSIRKTEV